MDGLNPNGTLLTLEYVAGGVAVGLANWSARGLASEWTPVGTTEGEVWRDVNGVLRFSPGIGGVKWRLRLSASDLAPPAFAHVGHGLVCRVTAADWWVVLDSESPTRPAAEVRAVPTAEGGSYTAFRPILTMMLTERSWSRPDEWQPDRRWSMTWEEV